MRSPNRSRRAGYVSMLAVSFAFGLAIFGTAVAVSSRAYLTAALTEERRILDRLRLESVAYDHLGRLVASGARETDAARREDGDQIALTRSTPMTKTDPAIDDVDTVIAAIQAATPSLDAATIQAALRRQPESITALVRLLALDGRAEDALRARLTYGRAPAPRSEPADEGQDLRPIAGDQVDLRLAAERGAHTTVLWLRVRFTGTETGWRTHDFRVMRLPAGRAPAGASKAAIQGSMSH